MEYKKITSFFFKILINPLNIIYIIRYIKYSFTFGSLGKNTIIYGKIWYSKPKNIFIGHRCKIGPYCRIETFPNYGKRNTNPKLSIGDDSSLQHAVHIYCADLLTIGSGVLIASGCMITDNNHGMDPEGILYENQPLISKPTLIEDGVWLGENVCVLSGSKIGKRSIIGSNSVVKGKIPSYTIASGNPAKVIKYYNFETKTWEKV